MKKHPPTIAVLGSLNVDLIASVERLPRPGETVASTGLRQLFGGKGANQAIAAARQGAVVHFIGSLGGDPEGRAYRRRLRAEGIHTRGIATHRRARTGTAIIGVDAQAENLIMVSPEANALTSPEWIHKQHRLIATANALLTQFEVPTAAIVTAIQIANDARVPVILNPSPFRADFPWKRLRIDTLIVNESEARQLTGLNAGTLRRARGKWIDALTRRNIDRLVVTRGKRHTLALDRSGEFLEIPAIPVTPLDTVGAGDAFAGCLAAAIARGDELPRALRAANCAGALATLKPGAQEAIPTRRQVLQKLKTA